MRRVLLVLLLVIAGCSSSNGGADSTSPTSIRGNATLAAPVRRFVARAKAPGTVAFHATYHVVRALGGETDVTVDADPPKWTITAGDLIVTGGPKASTCHGAACVQGIREPDLEPVGVFSRFFADAPARALEADARRVGAGPIAFSDRTVAGTKVRCAEVPIEGVTASTYCLTDDGVFALVDNTSVHYELTSYAVTTG